MHGVSFDDPNLFAILLAASTSARPADWQAPQLGGSCPWLPEMSMEKN
jgi:hypothetical protein